MLGAVLVLLLLGVVVSACGSSPVAQNWPGLTLAGDRIYVISGTPQQVYILDAETGVQQATFMPQGEYKGVVYWSPVEVGGGMAFVGFAEDGSGTAGLYAFDPETGQELWSVPAESLIIPPPVYADGVVYFGTSGSSRASTGKLYAVDVETRAVKPGWPFEAENAIWGAPLIEDGRVYLAAQDHYVYCLDAETGELIWRQKVDGAMAEQPTLDAERGVLYVGTLDARVYALKTDSGEPVEGFEFRAENWVWSKVLIQDDQLYVTALDGKLYALDPASGAVIPPYPYDSSKIEDKDDALRASPVEAGEFIIVAAESGRVIATQNAVKQWHWPGGVPEGSVLTTPVVLGNSIYIVMMNGDVQRLDAENGVPGWTFSSPGSE